MPDTIHVRDLLLRAVIGVTDEERRDRQDVLINIDFDVDVRAAGQSDDIDDTVNYRSVTKQIIGLIEDAEFRLVETMATKVAAICLEDQRVQAVRVTIEKPQALRFARTVGVTIERVQGNI